MVLDQQWFWDIEKTRNDTTSSLYAGILKRDCKWVTNNVKITIKNLEQFDDMIRHHHNSMNNNFWFYSDNSFPKQ